MKFEIEIPDERVEELRDFMENFFDYDHRLSPSEVIKEAFIVDCQRHGAECDIRDVVKVRQLGD